MRFGRRIRRTRRGDYELRLPDEERALLRSVAPQLRALLDGDLGDDAALAEALGLLRVHPAMAGARARLASCVDEARSIVALLPDGPAREALASLTDYVLARTG